MGQSDIKTIIGIQTWWEEPNSKTGWESSGWLREDWVKLQPDLYNIEIEEVLETDKHGHPIKAKLKIII